jgi:hypothetical protein
LSGRRIAWRPPRWPPLVGLPPGLLDLPLTVGVRRIDLVALGVELRPAGFRASLGVELDLGRAGAGAARFLPHGDLGPLEVRGGPEGLVVRDPPDDLLDAGLDLVEEDHGRPCRGVAAAGQAPSRPR